MPYAEPARRNVRPIGTAAPRPPGAGAAPPSGTLPFDYAAVFPLRGEPGNVVQDVITIGTDSPFMAMGISYGLESQRGRPLEQDVTVTAPIAIGDLTLSQLPLDALIHGIRFNPRYLNTLLNTDPNLLERDDLLPVERGLSTQPLSPEFLRRNAFERVSPPFSTRFSLSVVDTASGRELQDQPVYSVASLGEAEGRRPFRLFSQPFFLERRSTVRLQVTEDTPDTRGNLFIVLFGYKLLSASNCPAPAPPGPPAAIAGRAIPFDYVARLTMTGVPGNRVEQEIAVEAESGFRVAAIGYGLNTPDDSAPLLPSAATPPPFASRPLRDLPADAWVDGIRIRPGFLRFALDPLANLAANLTASLADRVFERLNRPEDVSFRYEITDGGIGRDLQNQPIHNIAGLGSADGRRPFKRLMRPLEFSPRSTLKIAIEEIFGRGELYLTFQGYRLPDAGVRR